MSNGLVPFEKGDPRMFDHEFDLRQHFNRVGRMQRSTMGAQLEHARIAHFDSSGHAIGRRSSWAWLNGRDAPIYVSGARYETGGYELDVDGIHLLSGAGRRLARLPAGCFEVLEAYYGDAGARWEAEAQVRFAGDMLKDPTTPIVHRGRGPGAIVSLFSFTSAGKELVRAERELFEARVPPESKAAKRLAGERRQRAKRLAQAISVIENDRGNILRRRDEADAAIREQEANKVRAMLAEQPARAVMLRAVNAALDAGRERSRALYHALESIDETKRWLTRLLGCLDRADLPAATTLKTVVLTEEEAADIRSGNSASPVAHLPAIAVREHLTDDELLVAMFFAHRPKHDTKREALIEEATNQAERLHAHALAAWRRTATPKREALEATG